MNLLDKSQSISHSGLKYDVQPVMASGRVRTGIRPGTDRYLSGPGSGRFSNMVRSGRVGPASVKYPRNLGRPPEPVRTDRVFISM